MVVPGAVNYTFQSRTASIKETNSPACTRENMLFRELEHLQRRELGIHTFYFCEEKGIKPTACQHKLALNHQWAEGVEGSFSRHTIRTPILPGKQKCTWFLAPWSIRPACHLVPAPPVLERCSSQELFDTEWFTKLHQRKVAAPQALKSLRKLFCNQAPFFRGI